MKKETNEAQNAPRFLDAELRLPEGWLKTDRTPLFWRATLDNESVVHALWNYYSKCAETLASDLESRLYPNERFNEGVRDKFVIAMTARALQHIDDQFDQSVRDAISLVLQEGLNRIAKFLEESLGADEATQRAAFPPRESIEAKALQLLRRRRKSVQFRGPGRVGEWTRPGLKKAVLDAMRQIQNSRNRTKGRVAAIVFGEDFEKMSIDERKALTVKMHSLLKDHQIDYAELDTIDNQRRERKIN